MPSKPTHIIYTHANPNELIAARPPIDHNNEGLNFETGAAADSAADSVGIGIIELDGLPVVAAMENSAVEPEAFLHSDGGASALPGTKFTAAHCSLRLRVSKTRSTQQ